MEGRVSSHSREAGAHGTAGWAPLIQPGHQIATGPPGRKENPDHEPVAAFCSLACGPPGQAWLEAGHCPLGYLGRSLLGVGAPRRRRGAQQGAPRRPREFTPEERKEATYWSKRRRNNEAARRSRQRRRLEELQLEARALELLRENQRLRAALSAITGGCCTLGADPRAYPPEIADYPWGPLLPQPPGAGAAPQGPHLPPRPQCARRIHRPWADSGQEPCAPSDGTPAKQGPSLSLPNAPSAPQLPHKLRHKCAGSTEERGQRVQPGGQPGGPRQDTHGQLSALSTSLSRWHPANS